MSQELDRIKHSRRRQLTDNTVKRQTKIAKDHGIPIDEPHKFAKHHATNCGNTKCIMCASPRKIFGEPTIQERRFDQQKLHIDNE